MDCGLVAYILFGASVAALHVDGTVVLDRNTNCLPDSAARHKKKIDLVPQERKVGGGHCGI